MRKLAAFLVLFLGLAVPLSSFASETFYDLGEMCGGEAYSNCGVEKNREILKAAVTQAQAKNRDLVVIVGADWCPPCQKLSKSLHADEAGVEAAVGDTVMIVKVNADQGDFLMADLKMLNSGVDVGKIEGVPTIFMVQVEQAKVTIVDVGYGDLDSLISKIKSAQKN